MGQFTAQLHCLLQVFAILHCFGTKNLLSSHLQCSQVSSSGAALHLRGESFDISCSEETRHWYVLSNYISAACAEELKHAQKGHCPGDLDLPIKTSSDNAVYLRRHMTLHRYCLPSLHWESKDNISLAESKGKMKNCHFQWVKSPQSQFNYLQFAIFLIIVTFDDLVWIITLATINQSCEIAWQKNWNTCTC